MLAEGAPCAVANWRPYPSQLFADGARIEAAFRRYCHRSEDGWRANYKEQATAKAAAKKESARDGGDPPEPVEEKSYEGEYSHGP